MRIATVRVWPIDQAPAIVRVLCQDGQAPSDAERRAGADIWPMWATRHPEFVGWDLSENTDVEK